ncbi:hypothetical protein Moror_5719 [Moniliophthora roreri MCA 2997]|uniref:F-box domain-containing protein n=2 Tax=Moniliophthora roreri TaxID=221103 RepID=V2WKH4_MONRO|nr:hypothetical protein Moror_5719 [Moniliophthora roreri MCA 2997]KAI3614490.1 hypothetical protein WG66_009705 [Moniliophthora roreri]
MAPFIAPELVLCILQHFPSYPFHDLNNCALVCRSWTPHARSIIFRDIRLLSAERTIKLIDLLTSPHETIAAAIERINIEEGWFGDSVFSSLGGSRAINPGAGKILEAFTTASERSLSFPHVRQLNLEKIEWGSVSPSVRMTFMDPNLFQSLVWLRLSSCSFETYAQYWELIHSFPLLETFYHGGCLDIPFESVDRVTSLRPLRLRTLHWHATDIPSKGTWQNAALAFNALLLESGESLEELAFVVTEERRARYLDNLDATQTLKDLFSMFDLTHNTRLRKLHIWVVSSIKAESCIFLPAFLKNMTRTQSNTLRDLSLSGFIPPNYHYPRSESDTDNCYTFLVDLAAMDTILRHPFFSSLQRITFGDFRYIFSNSDVTNQRLAGKTTFERPDDDSIPGKQLSLAIERLKASFVGSGKAGIVVPVVNAHYIPPLVYDSDRYEGIYDDSD